MNDVLATFRKCGALLEGHFVLTSGLHSNRYLQCAKVLQYPDLAEACGAGVAALFHSEAPTVVIGPAIGGIVIAQEVGRALRVRALFAERENGVMTLRRGFELRDNERVLVVEDVITTGGSAREVVEMAAARGAAVVGVGCIIDRSDGQACFSAPLRALATIAVATYAPESCPLCAQGSPAIKPGSRGAHAR
jgi:orotate phosphoribosyltransferase